MLCPLGFTFSRHTPLVLFPICMCSVNVYGHLYTTEPRSTLKTAVEKLACVLGTYVPGPMRRVDASDALVRLSVACFALSSCKPPRP